MQPVGLASPSVKEEAFSVTSDPGSLMLVYGGFRRAELLQKFDFNGAVQNLRAGIVTLDRDRSAA
jgi:hypothetical protein